MTRNPARLSPRQSGDVSAWPSFCSLGGPRGQPALEGASGFRGGEVVIWHPGLLPLVGLYPFQPAATRCFVRWRRTDARSRAPQDGWAACPGRRHRGTLFGDASARGSGDPGPTAALRERLPHLAAAGRPRAPGGPGVGRGFEAAPPRGLKRHMVDGV